MTTLLERADLGPLGRHPSPLPCLSCTFCSVSYWQEFVVNRGTLCFLVMCIVLVTKSPSGQRGIVMPTYMAWPASERSVSRWFQSKKQKTNKQTKTSCPCLSLYSKNHKTLRITETFIKLSCLSLSSRPANWTGGKVTPSCHLLTNLTLQPRSVSHQVTLGIIGDIVLDHSFVNVMLISKVCLLEYSVFGRKVPA